MKQLEELYNSLDYLKFGKGDWAAYAALRGCEPQLVSLIETTEDFIQKECLTVFWKKEPVSSISWLAACNHAKKGTGRDVYARIDLILTKAAYRRLGLSRMMIFACMAEILSEYRQRLYSVSCLAAHPAVAHSLEALDFHPKKTSAEGFIHEELPVDAANNNPSVWADYLKTHLLQCNYRLLHAEDKHA